MKILVYFWLNFVDNKHVGYGMVGKTLHRIGFLVELLTFLFESLHWFVNILAKDALRYV